MNRESGTKKALINAGIHELHDKGFNDFSIRRVASTCGISCAAPYRHFKNKDEFVLAIFKYINRQWYLTQNMILSEYNGLRERLTEMCVAYLRFLLDNPDYFMILTNINDSFNAEQKREISGISVCVRGLIGKYCQEVGMADADRIRKTYTVRSLIFGAAMMMISGELDDSEDNLDMVRSVIAREFELT